MIRELRLTNFKGFDDHVMPFQQRTVIVGKNNAGKSTVIEALRLIGSVANSYQHLPLHNVPRWLKIPKACKGLLPNVGDTEISFESLFHRYGDPPAIVSALFESGQTITVYVGKNGTAHSVITDEDGRTLTTESEFEELFIPDVKVLPRIGPLARKERLLTSSHVSRSLDTSLSSAHFRNQLTWYYEYFDRFKELSESTWPGLRLIDLESPDQLSTKGNISLLVQDSNFVAEVAWMGHGLQIWLQLMWFLTRTSDPDFYHDEDTLIFDEPDVYMHADLQRRFVRVLRPFSQQVIIATHSTEMLSEIEPDELLIVDRAKRRSNFASSLPAVQKVMNRIGSAHNIQFAKLWSARRFLLVEGDDLLYLKYFQSILFPSTLFPLDMIPHNSIGGWGGWNSVRGSQLVLQNAAGEDIMTYCILDSDYHSPRQIAERSEEATQQGIQLHIWARKEIENYFLIPKAIRRVIKQDVIDGVPPTIGEVRNQIDLMANALRDEIFDAMAHDYITDDRAKGVPGANDRARARLNHAWLNSSGRLSVLPGKKVMSNLSRWSQENYGVSFGISRLAKAILPSEINKEVVEVITAIQDLEKFRQRFPRRHKPS